MKRKNFPHRTEQRRKDATKRQEVYDSLSLSERYNLCKQRRGNSEKERQRLEIEAMKQGIVLG